MSRGKTTQHPNATLRTQFAQRVPAALVEAHGVHGLAGGRFDAHVFPFGRQQVDEDLLHVVLVKVFPVVGCTQEFGQWRESGLRLKVVCLLSSSPLTVQRSFGKAGHCVVSYVSDLGDEHKLH